ncbi:putative phosphodiesterase [Cyclospora cayetanensis]|uniref:Phosphodiesterase n=1 Tax=Cyclospora cayetanensis TaxID=88456 RepID=A0A1D3D778_9EIME|nr:putative phosphodiesterase [Cyclospora cayetanensis]
MDPLASVSLQSPSDDQDADTSPVQPPAACNHGNREEGRGLGADSGSSVLTPLPRGGWRSSRDDTRHASELTPFRMHKTVSFQPDASPVSGTSHGPSFSVITTLRSDGYPNGANSWVCRSGNTGLGRGTEGSGPKLRQLSGCTEEGDVCSSTSVPVPQERHGSRYRHTDTGSPRNGREEGDTVAHHAATSQSPLSRRMLSFLLSPFRELGGGELNFAWAYKEATAAHHRSCTPNDAGNDDSKGSLSSSSDNGDDHWSSQLSDAHKKASPGLKYFPLQFRDEDAEREYVAVTNYQCALRVSIFLLLQHCVLFPIQLLFFFSDPHSHLGSMSSRCFMRPLVFAYVAVAIFGLSLSLALLYPRLFPWEVGYICRRYSGQLACVYSFAYSVALSGSLVGGQVKMSNDLEESLAFHGKHIDLSIAVPHLFSFNTEISLLYVYAFASNLLFLDIIGPILTKWTLLLHAFTSAGLTAPFIVGFANGSLFSLCTLLTVASISIILSCMAFAGRMSGELQHRLLFLQWRRSRLRLVELLNEEQATTTNRTAMENVVGELDQCGKILRHLRNIKVDFGKEFDELYRIVSERTLLTSEDLYTIDIGNTDVGLSRFVRRAPQFKYHRCGGRRTAQQAGNDTASDGEHEGSRVSHAGSACLASSMTLRLLDQETQGRSLLLVGAALLRPVVCDWGCGTDELCEFLWTLQSQYQRNPYHNQTHAAMVGHATVCLANLLGIWLLMDPLEKAALIAATLAHDVGHPGRTNQFFVTCFDPLAIIYNDHAPLENFHSCLCFRILERKSCNLFFLLSSSAFRFVRAKIIETILSTDMKQHFEAISKFRVRRLNEEFSMKASVEDRWAALKICMKMGDISHTAIPWNEHFDMSDEVMSMLNSNMEKWNSLAVEGAVVSLPTTSKMTQSRTYTLHAVRNIAGPAMAFTSGKPDSEASGDCLRGRRLHNSQQQLPNASDASGQDMMPTLQPFDWVGAQDGVASQWSPRFTVDTVTTRKCSSSDSIISQQKQGSEDS